MINVKIETLKDLEFAFNVRYSHIEDDFADKFWTNYSRGIEWWMLFTEKEYKEYLSYVK